MIRPTHYLLIGLLLIATSTTSGCRTAKTYLTSWKAARLATTDTPSFQRTDLPAPSFTRPADSPPLTTSGEATPQPPDAQSLDDLTANESLPNVDLSPPPTPGKGGIGGAVSIGWSTGASF